MVSTKRSAYWLGLFLSCCIGSLTAQDSLPLQLVDIPPLFQGCDDPLISPEQRQACSAPKLQAFVQEHLSYPDSARLNGVEGVVLIRFHVSEEGAITEVELLRDIGSGCGQEAMRVVRTMPNFTPARREGQPIATSMVLPIRFKLPESSVVRQEQAYQLGWGTAYHETFSKKQLANLAKRHLIVRDAYGQEYEVKRIQMVVRTPRKTSTLTANGSFFSPTMRKALQRLRPYHRITWVATIEAKHQPINVQKTWTITP